jgi:AcrR family transcriptional regulator
MAEQEAVRSGSMPGTLPGRLRGADRREHILSVAEALYLEHGPMAVSTRMIADKVGISQPSLYAHFPTKRAITLALTGRAFGVMEQRMQAHGLLGASSMATGRGLAHLEDSIRAYIRFAFEEPTAYRIAFMLETPDPPTQAEKEGLPGYRVYEMFAAEVEALQAAGVLRAAPPGVLAQSIWAGMHGLCALLLARAAFPWSGREALTDFHVGLLVRGAAA